MLTISAIWVDQTIENHPETSAILARFKSEIPVTYIDDISKATHAFNNQPNAFYKGKKIVLLTSLKGDILKPCPGTHHYLCCGYEILNSGLNCQFNCAYCYLQTYMTTPFLTIFVNLPERVLEISQLLDTRQRRIGTGEFTDSLVLDPVTNHSQLLINTFRTLPNILLELKTKSLNIANLLLIPASRNSVVSWSLNPQTVINALEPGLPSLIQRLYAAQQVQNHGYKLAFHFDPIVAYPEWENDYANTIKLLYSYISKENIIWISMGALRYTKDLKPQLLKQATNKHMILQETIIGDDQKIRYVRSLRERLFRHLRNTMKTYHSKQFTYLCMENADVWQSVYGFSHKNNHEFSTWFNNSVFL